jgi:hypothetical protein
MAKPTTKIKSVEVLISRGNTKLGKIAVGRQYIEWKPAGKQKWVGKSWNQFHDWITQKP